MKVLVLIAGWMICTRRLLQPSRLGAPVSRGLVGCSLVPVLLSFAMLPAIAPAAAPARVASLSADSLIEPLGLDNQAPMLAWKLEDSAAGAVQTAYEIEVYSRVPKGRPDVWDSGRVASPVSAGVGYAGPRLKPSTRYYWRVRVWDKDSHPYPVSEASWWETGLLDQAAWQGQWIGYESAELHSLRTSGAAWITNHPAPGEPAPEPGKLLHGYRLHFTLDKPVRSAVLYTTGQDSPAAWINGTQVIETRPLPPWKHMPWQTYERQDITSTLRPGTNLLAIGITQYDAQPGAPTNASPMSACVYVTYADGSTQLFISDARHWKAALNMRGDWWSPSYDDAAWSPAEPFAAAGGFGSDPPGRPWPTGPVALLRRSFSASNRVISARLYATSLGAYRFSINGQPVGDQFMAPGWMDFREHVPYQVYDVTAQIKPGSNAIGAYLAPGWYATPLKWYGEGNNYGDTQPALRAQLRLAYADGSVSWVATDASWKAAQSEILEAEIYDGETVDARRKIAGWDQPGLKDSDWPAATLVSPKEPRILPQYFQPIRVERVLSAKSVSSPAKGVYVLDFGQNMSAVPRLRVRGRRGDEIRLRYAEVLNDDGTIYTDNLRTAKATDHYILAGGEVEVFRPEFTFHGFRYMEVTGLREAPTDETLQAVVLHTDAPFTARLETGSPMVNQLWSNVLWGQRSNFVGLPTDCPQRDERLGWSADAQVFWRTATYNMDLTTFSQKYAADLTGTLVGTAMYGIFAPGTDQANPGHGAAWSDAGVIVQWTGWIQSGNRRIIDENWDGMQHYLATLEQENPDHLWRNDFGAAFGDWLTPTITTPEDLLATAYWAYDAAMMQQMALATGRTAEAASYAAMHEKIKAAFEKAYVRPDGTVGAVDHYPSIPPPTIHPEAGDQSKDRFVETQTGYVLALHMDLVPSELREAAAKQLVDKIKENHWLLGTGFLGTPYLLEVLCDTGYSDVAYRLLLNEEYPSWGYLIDHGATTTWERWNGDQMRGDPSMNSYNHYAYGAVAEWIYRYGAGIDTTADDAGFHTVYLHPHFDSRLKHLSLDYDSSYGTIHSDWTVVGDQVTWHVIVPANARAVFKEDKTNADTYRVDGHSLADTGSVHKVAEKAYELSAGTYTFTARVSAPRTY